MSENNLNGNRAFLDSFEDGLRDIANGKMVIVVDDEDRENEGDLVQASVFITPESVNFMAAHGRGMICACLTDERCRALNLRQQVAENTAKLGTAFTESVDYLYGTTTGISAFDRAKTIHALIDPSTKPSDLGRPGHIHPLRAHPGGVLARPGQTEATVDLARLAGLIPSGVLCEVMGDDGKMLRGNELRAYADKHGLKIISVEQIAIHRAQNEIFMEERVRVPFPNKFGRFTLAHFVDSIKGDDHLAIIKEPLDLTKPVLVRAHSECLTGDVFGSGRCDCGAQLEAALRRMEDEGSGVLVYLRQEGRGIGLAAKLQAYKLQDNGLDTVEANLKLGFKADLRGYAACAQILKLLGVKQVRLITNNPAKLDDLRKYGMEIVERVPALSEPTNANRKYLAAKRDKLGHLIELK
ncbi:MAG: GTP cyclohydrolase II [Calditrichaeota bacterium]|nr:GTP cyclohydrolase II [Calditrichota bacterium]MCB9368443.1 GTP cyclohydrolase II [Calditrichota bacterium]